MKLPVHPRRPGRGPRRRRLLGAVLTLGALVGPVLGPPSMARADENELKNDVRLEGYEGKKPVLDGGAATSYLLLFALGVVGLAVMFKDAKRSHLD